MHTHGHELPHARHLIPRAGLDGRGAGDDVTQTGHDLPAIRKLLTLLTAIEQQAAVHDLGLLISGPSSAKQRVAVLAATPGQLLGVVLQDYKRARLKKLCRALGFSDAGKE